jgi:hypothetical protein
MWRTEGESQAVGQNVSSSVNSSYCTYSSTLVTTHAANESLEHLLPFSVLVVSTAEISITDEGVWTLLCMKGGHGTTALSSAAFV